MYSVPVRDPGTGELLGHASKINEKGFRLTSSDPLSLGRTYTIALGPTTDGDMSEPVEITARAVWIDRAENPILHATGLRFRDLAGATLSHIRSLVDQLAYLT